MNFFINIARFFSLKPYRMYLLLFVMAVSLFGFLQLDPTFADPDSFYHAKMAVLLSDQGVIDQFPWLSATDLKNTFTDHHLIYHVALVPFVRLFDPLIGVKVASVFFGTAVILFIFWLLRHLGVRKAFWYSLLLLTVNPFVFRLGLIKAQPLVLLFLFIFIYLLFSRYYLWLIFITAVYTWLYAGWPLLLLMVVVYSAINIIISANRKSWLLFKVSRLKAFKNNLMPIVSVVIGLAAGIFFSPYFPDNLKFFYQQSFQIAVINYQSVINVGAEWHPYDLLSLVAATTPFFILLILAVGAFILTAKKQSSNSWFFLVMTTIFFILTLKSRRYVEYFVPFGLCFSALSLSAYWDVFGKSVKKAVGDKVLYLLPLILVILIAPFAIRDIALVKSNYQNGSSFSRFQAASAWLINNSEPEDIVLHSDWDEFPILFYHNAHNRYIVGLDPTFMYEYDADLYNRWVSVVNGKAKEDMHQIVKKIFGASYVFVDYNQNQAFDRNMEDNINFEKVFEDSEAKIYLVK